MRSRVTPSTGSGASTSDAGESAGESVRLTGPSVAAGGGRAAQARRAGTVRVTGHSAVATGHGSHGGRQPRSHGGRYRPTGHPAGSLGQPSSGLRGTARARASSPAARSSAVPPVAPGIPAWLPVGPGSPPAGSGRGGRAGAAGFAVVGWSIPGPPRAGVAGRSAPPWPTAPGTVVGSYPGAPCGGGGG